MPEDGQTARPESTASTALAVRDISVQFGATQALRGANLSVRAGTVHALLGENGSGKSTLIKALAGVVAAQPGGSIKIADTHLTTTDINPTVAYHLGLRFVHQDLGLFDNMTVAENVALYSGYPTRTDGRIAWKELKADVIPLLERFEIDADPATPVGQLRPAMRTMLAIARALRTDQDQLRHVLVLDEPTVSLSAAEAELLLRLLRRRAESGDTVIFVSHRLREVLSAAHELTVLRDGATIATLDAGLTSEREVGHLIAGRSIKTSGPLAPGPNSASPAARIENLSTDRISGFSLTIERGEVVGLAGLVGSGRSAILRALFGHDPTATGFVQVGDRTGPFRSPADAMNAGIAYVPKDRAREASLADLSVTDNLAITVLNRYFRRFLLRRRLEEEQSYRLIERFGIACESGRQPIATLSGGNQQKVILARWLQRNPALLLLNEPTQGVDIGARADIYEAIRDACAAGCGVLVASSDLDELAQLCNRVCIMSEGVVVAEYAPPDTAPSQLFNAIHASAKTWVA